MDPVVADIPIPVSTTGADVTTILTTIMGRITAIRDSTPGAAATAVAEEEMAAAVGGTEECIASSARFARTQHASYPPSGTRLRGFR